MRKDNLNLALLVVLVLVTLDSYAQVKIKDQKIDYLPYIGEYGIEKDSILLIQNHRTFNKPVRIHARKYLHLILNYVTAPSLVVSVPPAPSINGHTDATIYGSRLDKLDFLTTNPSSNFVIIRSSASEINALVTGALLIRSVKCVSFHIHESESVYIDSLHFVTDSEIFASKTVSISQLIAPLNKRVKINPLDTAIKVKLILTDLKTLDYIDIDYSYFEIKLENREWADTLRLLQLLKAHQEKLSYSKGIEKAEMRLNSYLIKKSGWLDKIIFKVRQRWDNLGHDKSNIFPVTLGLFTIFLLINWLFFRTLYYEVYPLDILESYVRKNNPFLLGRFDYLVRIFPYCIYFTVIIFFGLRLQLKTLRLERKLLVFYIFVQYLLGLICLAYITSFIIVK